MKFKNLLVIAAGLSLSARKPMSIMISREKERQLNQPISF